MALSCYILEGTWWNHKEVPQVLPYFQALELTDGGIRLSHRSVRTLDDIKYWASKIPKNERAFYTLLVMEKGNLCSLFLAARMQFQMMYCWMLCMILLRKMQWIFFTLDAVK